VADKESSRIASDGLPASEVGNWTLQKHERLRRYIGISAATRQKYLGNRKAGATYIDLYCGYGRSFIKGSDKEIPGSPIVAVEEANTRKAPFTEVHIADLSAEAVEAAQQRLTACGAVVRKEVGPAVETVTRITRKIDPFGLHFAFLDPFKMDLPFTIIEQLAGLKRMDMIIHVSIHDFQRNLQLYAKKENGPIDQFAPGWRQKVDLGSSNAAFVRSEIFDHWLDLIRALDMQPFKQVESVHGSKGQRLYWLVFVARHGLAAQFWDKIRNVTGQGTLL